MNTLTNSPFSIPGKMLQLTGNLTAAAICAALTSRIKCYPAYPLAFEIKAISTAANFCNNLKWKLIQMPVNHSLILGLIAIMVQYG